MRTFSVKNFDRFQHYKDRAPPWIKLYNELLDDYEFGRLPDASKMHLIAIWLLASRSENKIPYDPAWVAGRINATSTVDLDLLAKTGFILINQPLHNVEHVASVALAECLPRVEVEERQIRGEESTGADAPRARSVEKKSRKGNATPLPDGYLLPEKIRTYGLAQGLSRAEIDRDHQRFCNHAKQNDRRCVDWEAAERNWLLGSAEKLGRSPVSSEVSSGEAPGFEAAFGSEELDAWDAYGKQKTGKTFPRNSKGGWRFPTQWPPGHVQIERSSSPAIVPLAREMRS